MPTITGAMKAESR